MASKTKGNVADHDRTFIVYIDKNVVGCEPEEETVTVPAGEDADKWCEEVLNTLIGNELDTGWYEKK